MTSFEQLHKPRWQPGWRQLAHDRRQPRGRRAHPEHSDERVPAVQMAAQIILAESPSTITAGVPCDVHHRSKIGAIRHRAMVASCRSWRALRFCGCIATGRIAAAAPARSGREARSENCPRSLRSAAAHARRSAWSLRPIFVRAPRSPLMDNDCRCPRPCFARRCRNARRRSTACP